MYGRDDHVEKRKSAGPLKKFFFTTLIGLAPWSFIFGSVGQGLEEIFINKTKLSFSLVAQPEYLIPIGFIAILIIMIIFFMLYRRYKFVKIKSTYIN